MDIKKFAKIKGSFSLPFDIADIAKLHTQLLLFWFQLIRSADKIDEDYAVVHLVLPSHPPPRECKDLLPRTSTKLYVHEFGSRV